MKTILINVDELWLRGKNRKSYFRMLRGQLASRIKNFHSDHFSIKNENQRLVLKSKTEFNRELVENLKYLPGLHSLLPVLECESEMEQIKSLSRDLIDDLLKNDDQKRTFKVTTQRADKKTIFTSMDVSREVGGYLLSLYPQLKVELKKPELELQIKVSYQGKTYLTLEKVSGIGGLPLQSSGYGLSLLSGGFDSPVASVMMATRGISQHFVFFHAYPFVGDEVCEKIKKIASQLALFQQGCDLTIIPFGEIQKKIISRCEDKYRTNLFRWAMVVSANQLANEKNLECLITGDSLGQVSSQVLSSLYLLDQASSLPILRPLIGTQKKEILKKSRQYGFFDYSSMPHEDACQLMAPRNPVINPNKPYWDKVTDDLAQFLAEDFSTALSNATTYHFTSWAENLSETIEQSQL